MGEDDKQKRYKSKALPMVLETFGRFGPESEKVLDLLAMAAGHTQHVANQCCMCGAIGSGVPCGSRQRMRLCERWKWAWGTKPPTEATALSFLAFRVRLFLDCLC